MVTVKRTCLFRLPFTESPPARGLPNAGHQSRTIFHPTTTILATSVTVAKTNGKHDWSTNSRHHARPKTRTPTAIPTVSACPLPDGCSACHSPIGGWRAQLRTTTSGSAHRNYGPKDEFRHNAFINVGHSVYEDSRRDDAQQKRRPSEQEESKYGAMQRSSESDTETKKRDFAYQGTGSDTQDPSECAWLMHQRQQLGCHQSR